MLIQFKIRITLHRQKIGTDLSQAPVRLLTLLVYLLRSLTRQLSATLSNLFYSILFTLIDFFTKIGKKKISTFWKILILLIFAKLSLIEFSILFANARVDVETGLVKSLFICKRFAFEIYIKNGSVFNSCNSLHVYMYFSDPLKTYLSKRQLLSLQRDYKLALYCFRKKNLFFKPTNTFTDFFSQYIIVPHSVLAKSNHNYFYYVLVHFAP